MYRTLLAGDIDNDGDVDLVVTNNGGPTVTVTDGRGITGRSVFSGR